MLIELKPETHIYIFLALWKHRGWKHRGHARYCDLILKAHRESIESLYACDHACRRRMISYGPPATGPYGFQRPMGTDHT